MMNLYAQIKAVWQRRQLVSLTKGVLFFLPCFLLILLVGGLLDWLVHIPPAGRFLLLSALFAVPLIIAWRAGWRRLHAFNPTHTALRIEEEIGGMESLLVTAVQFNETGAQGTSRALADVACSRAEDAAGGISADKVVRLDPLRRPAALTCGVVLGIGLLMGILSLTNGDMVVAGLRRVFTPWVAVKYPTRTQMQLASGDIVVQEGKPVRIAAKLSGVIPRQAEIAIRTGTGKARERKLEVADNECEYMIATVFRSFEYRLRAGDAGSEWHKVEVVPAPGITRAAVQLEFPAYTERPGKTVEALTITVPETTAISWTLTLDRAVRDATVELAGGKSIPMTISEDGRTMRFHAVASESRAYGFSWVEKEHGFSFTSPSHYLQVAPDRPPRVELTKPRRSLYATLGRKLDLAFRGRDDHGVAEAFIAYRVDKTEEQKIAFTPARPVDGSEQAIDWDYRTVLPDLKIGQSVTFAIEMTDHYPGPAGPHRVRSDVRRMQFLSKEDYLAQLEKQKKRLLSRLRTVYREERDVHEVIIQLDPADPVFVQTCQLEAVRQNLMGARLEKLAVRMQELTDDLAANGIEAESLRASLAQLRADLLRITATNIKPAAEALRALASDSNGSAKLKAKAHATHLVNSVARELGLLVLHLGFEDAADVMARELHAAAQTQASLRMRTIMTAADDQGVADEQERLSKWLVRLFAASPKGKESTVEEALIEFTLTRLVKQMINDGIGERLQSAADLIRQTNAGQAARLQEEVIAVLLKAEFRLRAGSERETLVKAHRLFLKQAAAQKKLRLEMTALDKTAFDRRRDNLAREQNGLHRNLQLLLMPEIPARRTRLFDEVVPSPPPVGDLLGNAETAVKTAAERIADGDREAAETAQLAAEKSLLALADVITRRIAELMQQVRIDRLNYAAKDLDERLERFAERQLSLLEKTEDAAADGTKSDYLAEQQEGLIDAVEEMRAYLVKQIEAAPVRSEYPLAVPLRMSEALRLMRQAVPLLQQNKADKAAGLQIAVTDALAATRELLTEHGAQVAAYASIVGSTDRAVKPSPFVGEIESEQRHMLELTRKTKPEDLPQLAVPQKNLIHAVNAILTALDPIAHMVEFDTVMLFAKEDMDSAGIALAEKDPVEALDAQAFVAETMETLRGKVDAVIPQFHYALEIVEALQRSAQEGVLIREEQRRLAGKTQAATDLAPLIAAQQKLKARAQAHRARINRIAGLGLGDTVVQHMTAADTALRDADKAMAADYMAAAETAMKADAALAGRLMTLLAALLAPPMPGVEDPGEVVLLKDVLALAAEQKAFSRQVAAAKPDKLPAFQGKLSGFAKACDPFITRAKTHTNPVIDEDSRTGGEEPVPMPDLTGPANFHLKLETAKNGVLEAAAAVKAGDRAKAVASQVKAAESLRHFVAEYTLKFFQPPSDGGGDDAPVPTSEFNETDDAFNLFMPGAVTGTRPPDGKLEWEVLGRRERAALNENFARELPLEYRAILKDYYERLAR